MKATGGVSREAWRECGKRVALQRKRRLLKQSQLATRMERSAGYIAKFESDPSHANVKTWLRLIGVIGGTMDWYLAPVIADMRRSMRRWLEE